MTKQERIPITDRTTDAKKRAKNVIGRRDDHDKELLRLGKTLERILRKDYLEVNANWKRFILISFVRGLFIGLGSVVGATLLVALVVWLLNVFDGLPLIGDWFEDLQNSLKQGGS